MIPLKDLRERPEYYQKGADRKRIGVDINAFIELDQQYRELKQELEGLRADQNAFNKSLKKLKGEEKEKQLAQMKELAAKVKERSAQFKEIEEEWNKKQLEIPSPPLEKVPDGATDEENVELRTWGETPSFDFAAKDHIELGEALDLIDVERGVKISGARNYFLKGDGARLHQAVMRLAMDRLYQKGYTLFDPPILVHSAAMRGTGYFPGGEDQAYHLDDRDDDTFLIGTSEVPVCSYHMDEILDPGQLPKRYAGFTPCFRREAGAYGKDTHGIYRVHQFYKVEQVVLCLADEAESEKFHNELLSNAEEVMQLLELPYRVVDVCTGDLGMGQVYKNDIEAWMPSREKYSETHSCSTFFDFQARRLNIRYRGEDGKTVYCHTLNNTCIASPRVLIPLLEVHQQEDGSIRIPEALRPYMLGEEKIGPG